jgi:hypothetical protein
MLSTCRRLTGVAARGASRAMSAVPFNYEDLFQLNANPVDTPYKKLTSDYVSTIDVDGQEFLKVEPEALTLLAEHAMTDIAHLLRPAHLQQLSNILDDPEASENDRFVALEVRCMGGEVCVRAWLPSLKSDCPTVKTCLPNRIDGGPLPHTPRV